MIISLLLHALFIYLIPRPVEHKEKIGSYTQVQLIQSSLSPVPTKRPGKRPLPQEQKPVPAQQQEQKAVPVQQQAQELSPVQPQVQKNVPAQPQEQKAIPVPEMDSKVRDRMKTVRDVPMPSFNLPRPQQREIQPVSDAALKDDFLDHDLGDEVVAQQSRSPSAVQTPPQPREVPTIRQEQERQPVPEEKDFDQEAPEEKITQVGDPSIMSDIEWRGKPRRITRRPDHPPRYPEGYQGQTQGRIRLEFCVDSKGDVIQVRPIQKLDPRLDSVATDYLRQYKFEPLAGTARRAELEWGIIPFTFHLK